MRKMKKQKRKNKHRCKVLFSVILVVILGLIMLIGIWKFKHYAGSKEVNNHKIVEEATNRLTTSILQEKKDWLKKKSEPLIEANVEKDNEGDETASVIIDPVDLAPGDIITETVALANPNVYFYKQDIIEGSNVFNRINGKSYRKNDNIGLENLQYIKVIHYNFEQQVQVGEIITNASISDDVINIFKELFEAKYEIQSIYLIDNYWTGDGTSTDTASIEVNNTSCFNYREVTGGGGLSNHAYGSAIDINPQQNPYVWYKNGELHWTHDNATPYIDRNTGNPHVIVEGDVCYSIFAKYGFNWGGNWSSPIDYQHFERGGGTY